MRYFSYSQFLANYLYFLSFDFSHIEMSAPSNNNRPIRGRGNAWTRERVIVLANLIKERWQSLGLGDSSSLNNRRCLIDHYVLISGITFFS